VKLLCRTAAFGRLEVIAADRGTDRIETYWYRLRRR
jgi:hypothetical protein